MLQGAKKTFTKMNQDLAKTKYPDDIYYSGNNIRIVNNENNGNVVNIKGNTTRVTFPQIESTTDIETLSGQSLTKDLSSFFPDTEFAHLPNQHLGSIEINDVLYYFIEYKRSDFSTKELAIFTITETGGTYTTTLKFFDTLDFNSERFDIKGYYENENVIKLYWADGENQLRFINIANTDSINIATNFLSSVPSVTLSNPVITGFELSGDHTSGTIQYAYNLYNFNGAQTKVSPLSTFAYLNTNDIGNEVGEEINKAPTISISGIDTTYDRIRVYSLKYTSLNATPSVNIIYDRELVGSTLTLTDTNTNLVPFTFDEFLFLGGFVYIPKHLIIKDNVLFLANYKTQKQDIDFDTRAYSFSSGNTSRLLDNTESTTTINDPDDAVAETFDCINPSLTDQVGDTYYETYIHPFDDTSVRGGTGPNVEYVLKYNTTDISVDIRRGANSIGEVNQPYLQTSLKTGEIYRLFLEFLLEDGSWSFPKWVADVKIPVIGEFFNTANSNYLPITDDEARYIYIETSLLNAPADTNVVGWRTSLVERTDENKSVVSQGLLNTTIQDFVSDADYLPSYVQRCFKPTVTNSWSTSVDNEYLQPRVINKVSDITSIDYYLSNNETSSISNGQNGAEIVADQGDYLQSGAVHTIITPETIFYDKLPLSSGYIRRLGFVKNTESTTTREYLDADGNPTDTILTPVTGADLAVTVGTKVRTDGEILVGTGLSYSSNEEIITRASRLVGDTWDQSGAGHSAPSYTSKKFFFVRTFGGYEHYAEDYQAYDIQNNITFIKPEYGTQNIVFDSTVGGITYYRFASKASIAIKYDSIVYSYFNYNTGTSLAVMGLGNDYSLFSGSEEATLTSGNPYGLMVEFYRVLSTQYGGNSYEAKQNNITIPYSNVVDIDAGSQITVVHQGDTFIQKFKAVRTTKGDVASDTQITEIVDFPVETTINLDLRYDVLKYVVDNYDTEESTSYGFNSVYNQLDNTIKNFAKPSTFTELTNYTTGIIPTKTKIPGEDVDSFTDVLINDAKLLDPAYGSINALFEFNSNVYSFQDKAIAYIAINPRVQISGSDGIPIELGSGNLIERYQYITTNAGTVNKFSLVKAKNGLGFVDLYNKSISFLGGEGGTTEISTVAGMHSYLKTNLGTEFDNFKLDTLGNSIHSVYDNINEEILFTFNTDTPFNTTLVYNNLTQGFTSFYDSTPDIYIPFKNRIYSTSSASIIQEHYVDDYLNWEISLIIGNDPDYPKIFNNVHYNSNFYNGATELNNITFTRFTLDNGYQTATDSSFDPDSYTNIGKKRLRRWNFILPRETGTRNRFNSPWLKLDLKFLKSDLPTSPTNYQSYDIKGVLDDVLITYTLDKT